jgi:hypothetical protein
VCKISGSHGGEYEYECEMLHRVVSWKLTDVSQLLTVCTTIALMMEAVTTSETTVSFYETTRRSTPHVCDLTAVF